MGEYKPREFYIDAREHSGHYGSPSGRYTAWDTSKLRYSPSGIIHVIDIQAFHALLKEHQELKTKKDELIKFLQEQCVCSPPPAVQCIFCDKRDQICDLPKTIL